jgi:4a-hydroxytetrahydrobiopterin dehydratase
MENLTTQVCEACRADAPLLTQEEIARLMPEVQDWELKTDDNIQKLTRTFLTQNYAQSLALTNAVAALAEKANHHPLIILEYGAVTVEWWSHKIKGLHKNDFIMAAKTSELFV